VITPATGQSGSALITVSVSDGSAGTSTPFMLNVLAPFVAFILRIDLMVGKALVSWPSSSGPNWTLLGSMNPTFSGGWTTVAGTPVLANGRYWTTNLLTEPAQYFQ